MQTKLQSYDLVTSAIEIHTAKQFVLLLAIRWKQTYIKQAEYTEQEPERNINKASRKEGESNGTYKISVATTMTTKI